MKKPGNDVPFWEFKNSTESDTGEATLYIYGDIVTYDMGNWNFPDDVVPNKFKDELNNLGDVSTINVRINSGGGSVFAAYAIMNLLKSHKAQIIVHIDGIAASAATLIAMAGDKIISALGSVFMVHLPSTWAWGNSIEIQKTIDALKTITNSMVDVYHKKTKIPKADLMRMVEADTWLTGIEAKEKGFVDEVEEMEVEAYLSEDKTTAFFNGLNIDLDNFHNKERFVAMLPTKPTIKPQEPQNKPQEPQNKKEDTVMNLAELKANHPEIYNAAVQEGIAQATSSEALENARTEGIKAERARIQAIDNIALSGMEAITNKAKFETGISAEAYAMEVLASQKQKGITYLNNAHADATELDDVPTASTPQTDEAEEADLLACAADVAKTIRR